MRRTRGPAARARGWILAAACLATAVEGGVRAQTAASTPTQMVVEPFLANLRGKLSAPGAEEAWRPQVRAALAEIDALAAARTADFPARRRLTAEARASLRAGIAAELGAPNGAERAQVLVDLADKEERQARWDALERGVICWCPEENWTRTLAGCAQGCADEQKALIHQWVDEGMTNAEVLKRMVAHPKGGPKVRAVPEASGVAWLGYLFPAVFFAAGCIVVVGFLRRSMRPHRAPLPGSRPSAANGSEARGGPLASAEADPDAAIGERIEREVREMEE